MDVAMGGAAAGGKGVLTSTQGNAYRAAQAPAAGAKGGENAVFQKPAPRMPDAAGVTKQPGDAGKENTTASRGAAATASTSGEIEEAEKRWQVSDETHRQWFGPGAHLYARLNAVRRGRWRPSSSSHLMSEEAQTDIQLFFSFFSPTCAPEMGGMRARLTVKLDVRCSDQHPTSLTLLLFHSRS